MLIREFLCSRSLHFFFFRPEAILVEATPCPGRIKQRTQIVTPFVVARSALIVIYFIFHFPPLSLNVSICISDKGKSVDVTVVDRCTGCKETDLDFSPAAFDQLADESVGRLSGMTWTWAS